MKLLREHIIFKFAIVALVTVLLLPSAVKIAHVFENHKHEVCETPQKVHFHEFELDCEFYKFKVNPQVIFNPGVSDLTELTEGFASIISQYQFVSDYQRLSFFLRGPPSLV